MIEIEKRMIFEPNKIYFIVVITKKHPTILTFGERYKVLGKYIPNYCTEKDIKILTKQEWEAYETLDALNNITFSSMYEDKCDKCKLVIDRSELDLHNGKWLCHNCEENEQERN